MVWLDGLDMHIVNLLDASFREDYPGRVQPVSRPEGSAYAEAGRNLVPVGFCTSGQTSPIFNYPYRETREALEKLRRFREPDPCHGLKMRYINPLNGGPAMPTISTAMQLLPTGFRTRSYRCTSGTVFVAVEGKGAARIGERRFAWSPRDVFVVPSWNAFELEASTDAVLFSFSDQVVQEKLGLFREQRGAD
jgi:gentisate 1,2-dioxygenase